MYCIHCGAALPDYAKFCYQCGKKVDCKEKAKAPTCPGCVDGTPLAEECEIVYIPIQEKIGLFPKEKGRFDVISAGDTGGKVILSSPVFELGGFNIYGPQEKVPRHKEALDQLISELQNHGWVRQKKTAVPWYNVKFQRG